MATSIDWGSSVITVNQADLALIGGTLYELDTDAFRLELKALEATPDGMAFLKTHLHNTEVTVAGTTFARTVEIINGYSITFSPDAQWTVRLVGSNNNLFDVENLILNQNQVQVISTNSGGLIVREQGTSGLTAGEAADLAAAKAESELARKLIDADEVLSEVGGGTWVLVDADDGVTVLRTRDVRDKDGNPIEIPVKSPARRTKQ